MSRGLSDANMHTKLSSYELHVASATTTITLVHITMKRRRAQINEKLQKLIKKQKQI